MPFYEDQRIIDKNKKYNPENTKDYQEFILQLGKNTSLAQLLSILREHSFEVTLVGKTTIVIE